MTAHFEAKLHGFRRTQDGVVISYVVHPNDLSREMALAPLGTRYMVAFSEIGDDDKPISGAAPTKLNPSEVDAKMPKDHRPFSSLPLSQQAGIACNDPDFRQYLAELYHDIAADGPDAAANVLRRILDVKSRAEITVGSKASQLWGELWQEYQRAQTTARYAHVMRK